MGNRSLVPLFRPDAVPHLPPPLPRLLPSQLLNITRMIQKREAMKREQLMVQQEIFLQQHWDLTDTTGEARPLMITPGRYKTRPRQPAAAAAAASAAAGGAVGAGSVSGVTAPAVVQVRHVFF